MSRSFKVLKPKCDSIFHASTPVAAAKKACTRECKGKTCIVIVQDTKTDKQYKYRVSRIYDPVTVMRNGVEITYDYKVVATSLKSTSKTRTKSRTLGRKRCSPGKVWRRSSKRCVKKSRSRK
jgi:hypothetical protein